MDPVAPPASLKRTLSDIEAWLFDLDGVLTDTARVHAAAWKTAFDEVLARHFADRNGAFQAFDQVDDYEHYVDGKPRYDGVRDFLSSRGLTLAEGRKSDSFDRDTVYGVGNQNALVLERLAGNVTVFPGSVALVKRLRTAGRRTTVVSASENCKAVLEAAHIADLFDVVVDGRVVQREASSRQAGPRYVPPRCIATRSGSRPGPRSSRMRLRGSRPVTLGTSDWSSGSPEGPAPLRSWPWVRTWW